MSRVTLPASIQHRNTAARQLCTGDCIRFESPSLQLLIMTVSSTYIYIHILAQSVYEWGFAVPITAAIHPVQFAERFCNRHHRVQSHHHDCINRLSTGRRDYPFSVRPMNTSSSPTSTSCPSAAVACVYLPVQSRQTFCTALKDFEKDVQLVRIMQNRLHQQPPPTKRIMEFTTKPKQLSTERGGP